jgi:putative endonuclease
VRANTSTYFYGIFAEYLAMTLLWLKGYKILARRYKSHVGEIDLIARKNATLVFIEVKARRELDPRFLLVGPRQIDRLKRASMNYLARHGSLAGYSTRFDMVVVTHFIYVRHVKNAFL